MLERLIVLEREQGCPAAKSFVVISDTQQADGSHAIEGFRLEGFLPDPGFVFGEALRLYENPVLIDRSSAHGQASTQVSEVFLRLTDFFFATFFRGACLRFAAFRGLGSGAADVLRSSSGAKSSTAISAKILS